MPPNLILHAIGHELGAATEIAGLPELQGEPDLPETLTHLGLAHYTKSDLSVMELAGRSCRATLERAAIDPATVEALVVTTSSFARGETARLDMRRLHASLGLRRAHPVGLFGSECSNLHTALRVAADMVLARGLRHVLVVSSDRNESGPRLMDGFVSVFSDAATSCLVSGGGERGFQLDSLALQASVDMAELSAEANFIAYLKGVMNGAAAAVSGALAEARLTPADFRWLITGNYNSSVLRTYASQLGFDEAQVFRGKVASQGHAYAADTLISLDDLVKTEALAPGDRCLLLGTGQNTWGACALRALDRD